MNTLIEKHKALVDEDVIRELNSKFLQEKGSSPKASGDDLVTVNILLKPKVAPKSVNRAALEEQRVCLLMPTRCHCIGLGSRCARTDQS